MNMWVLLKSRYWNKTNKNILMLKSYEIHLREKKNPCKFFFISLLVLNMLLQI